ncbi:amidohydrolase/deacetylase family metallohydrolase [Sporosalibacterium faouarense]|uniref:amidohydrolase/deacetylase family metallohydrolase n=1 Tax=Sporosalibacterium faouarense TaxID=516123 RepID=UPI00141C87A8|nr:amidohydrolase/deacetylase family metallohydrolase [Sporosalibacterium faouarense]MTI46274.1 amidohydrolase/deacetylase family metallohydrolase [Bacillota bacterium]
MRDCLLIKSGTLLDVESGFKYLKKDIYIEDGIIKEIGDDLLDFKDNCSILQLDGEIVSPGFIDIHTHVYNGAGLGIDPDIVGIKSGVTTLFDAGSSGAKNFKDFYEGTIEKSKTGVISLLNIAYSGLEQLRYEIADPKNIIIEATKNVVEENRDYIKGIKARASASTVGDLGIKPIEIAKQVASDLGIPLVVHIGNYPPKIEDVLKLMDSGDVITHCFHGKPNGLLNENGDIKDETLEALKRGVLFDIGHGTSSFNFNIAEKAISKGFYPHIISTDIYKQNYNGPVYSLPVTINKMMALGMSLEDCISKVTTVPANTFNLNNIGMLNRGYKADITIFKINNSPMELEDSEGNVRETNKHIEVKYAIKNGELNRL